MITQNKEMKNISNVISNLNIYIYILLFENQEVSFLLLWLIQVIWPIVCLLE